MRLKKKQKQYLSSLLLGDHYDDYSLAYALSSTLSPIPSEG